MQVGSSSAYTDGTEVDMMRVDRLLQPMTRLGADGRFQPYNTPLMAYAAYLYVYTYLRLLQPKTRKPTS